MILLLALLLLATPAWAQAMGDHVDIQCRVVSAGGDVEVTSQTSGIPKAGDYWNCNVPMPYVPPGYWLCVTTPTKEQWPDKVRPYPRFVHDVPGHDYHSVPWNQTLITPMAFPANEPTKLIFKNGTGTRQWAQLRIAGYLGQPAGTAREGACR